MKKHFLLSAALTSLFTANCFAQPGSLDSDFNGDGKKTDFFDTDTDDGTSIVVQPDGKILVAGYSYIQGDHDFVIIRYTSDGNYDNTFSGDGMTSVNFGSLYNDFCMDMVLQSDGKIILAGHYYINSGNSDICMVRLNNDGSIDDTFGNSGKVFFDPGTANDYLRAVTLSPSGKLVITGDAWGDTFIAQFNADGSVDNTFGTSGLIVTQVANVSTYALEITCQPDGKILIAGYYAPDVTDIDFMLFRYNSDGTPDNTFSNDGMVNTDIAGGHERAYCLYLHDDGKISVAGISGNKSALVRYNANGTLDVSLNGSGKTELAGTDNYTVNNIEFQADGKYILGGNYHDPNVNFHSSFALMRLNYDGSFDNTFGTNGITTTTFDGNVNNELSDITIQPDLRIVATGGTGPYSALHDIATARYLSGLNLGVAEFSAAAAALIYPNPVNENETLNYTLLNDETLSIELYSTAGTLVKTFVKNEKRTAGPHSETLNFPAELAGGNYLLQLTTAQGVQTITIVK
ncbi:MAG: hypothetical protein POELPBGB_02417 [Bacteroidia bacterium]|nr:hypothetical protein [Bacteroidia bacterium]